MRINHAYGSPFPQRYHDLNTSQQRELREQYIEHFRGQCLYCEEQLEEEPHRFVRKRLATGTLNRLGLVGSI